MLLFTSMKNTRGHYARQKFYVYNQSLVPIRTFRPTTWLSDRRNINACNSPIDVKNVIIDAVLEQEKLYNIYHSRTERREKFLKKHKTFVYKDSVLFVKI